MEPRDFLKNICDISDEDVIALREQLYARYKTNVPLAKSGNFQAEEENERFMKFYAEVNSIKTLNYGNVTYKNGDFVLS